MLAWLYWNPSKEILPDFPFPLRWYGLLFALGFWVGYQWLVLLLRDELAMNPEFKQSDIRWALFEKRAKDPGSPLYSLLGGYFGQEKSLKRLNELLLEIEVSHPSTWVLALKGNGHLARKMAARDYLERNFPECFVTLKESSLRLCEMITGVVIFGTILGARLGHVFFYENLSEYLSQPWRILMIWEGGLASHGAVAAIAVVLAIFAKRHRHVIKGISLLWLLDLIVVPGVLAGAFIRVGNFFNQEILGEPSTLPWAIVFGNPAEGGDIVPRHPAQLYEALFYLITCGLLYRLNRRHVGSCGSGLMTGVAFAMVFGFRFCVEFLKVPQSKWWDGTSYLFMGQWLSLPLFITGIYLILRVVWAKRNQREFISD